MGDKVRVWMTGMYEESNPIQGEAINIEKFSEHIRLVCTILIRK
ncbi:hypothetical protein [Paenibacillus sp. DCT19]